MMPWIKRLSLITFAALAMKGLGSAKVEKIAGNEVAIVRTKSQRGSSTEYVVQPAADVLIIATSRSYLEDVLGHQNLKPEIRAHSPGIVEVTYRNPTAFNGATMFFSTLVAVLSDSF